MIRLTAILIVSLIAAQATAANCTRKCMGEAEYMDGLVFSPLAGASHSNRISLLTVRALASPQVEQIAETGMNGRFVTLAEGLVGKGVKNASAALEPTMPGNYTVLRFTVDCEHPFITVVGMIAPSPDWLVQISNVAMVQRGRFLKRRVGRLIAYDAGTDDGGAFTNPGDASLDMPTEPQKNIAPLVEDETDPFDGRFIGTYVISKV